MQHITFLGWIKISDIENNNIFCECLFINLICENIYLQMPDFLLYFL